MKKRLGDYIKEYSVRNKENQDIPVYSVTNTGGFCQDYFGKEVASKDKSTYKIVPQGYFAYNPSRINVGSVDWQRTQERVIVSPLYNVFSVSDELDQQYLYYYLKSDFALQRIKAVATGSVRDNLKLKMLYEFPINIPELSVQKNIVDILDKIKKLERLKKAELDDLDTLVKARFVEMFGDFRPNYTKWDIVSLDSVCTKISDGEHGSVPRVDKGHLYLNAKNIKIDGSIDWQNTTYISSEDHERIYKRCNPEMNDILLTTTGTIGNVAIVPAVEPFSLDRGITLLKLNDKKICSAFLMCLLKSKYLQQCMKKSVHASAIGHLFLNQVKILPVLLPSLELQNQFSDFVRYIDKSKSVIKKSLDETQILFQSLMQEYFG